jgi:hypothetical protein
MSGVSSSELDTCYTPSLALAVMAAPLHDGERDNVSGTRDAARLEHAASCVTTSQRPAFVACQARVREEPGVSRLVSVKMNDAAEKERPALASEAAAVA